MPYLRLIPAALLTAALTGCLDPAATDLPPPMCEIDTDCDHAQGEICDQGICWGDPPDSITFAAILVPPADRADLAPVELASLDIARDGTISGLGFTPTVTISGRVILACIDDQTEGCGDDHPVRAQIVAERPGSFPGAPRYRRRVMSRSDTREGEPSFSLELPADGAEYRVTILPDDDLSLESGQGAAAQAPPLSVTITADRDREVTWVLGDPDRLKTITGCVQNSLGIGTPFAGMHVSAHGRWTADAKLERASAVVLANGDGCFELRVPSEMLDTFDILAQPAPSSTLPTLRLAGEVVPDPSEEMPVVVHELAPLVMPNTPNPTRFQLAVRGLGSGGTPTPISGAELRFTTTFEPPHEEPRDLSITFTARAVTGGLGAEQPGVAEVLLYPGQFDRNRLYSVRVVPPTESEFSARFDLEVAVGTGENAPVLEAIELERRLAVSGTFVTAEGEPLVGAPLDVRLSPVVKWALTDPSLLQVVENLQFASDTTDGDGGFFVWLDRRLVGVDAVYDFELAPPASSAAPRWTFEAVDLPASQGSLELPPLALPEVSYARGTVSDAAGTPVPGAELRLYELPSGELCDRAPSTLAICDPPAKLRGIREADAAGQVTAILPDP